MARGSTAYLLAATALLAAFTLTVDAANFREAPITAPDHKADITDCGLYSGSSGAASDWRCSRRDWQRPQPEVEHLNSLVAAMIR